LHTPFLNLLLVFNYFRIVIFLFLYYFFSTLKKTKVYLIKQKTRKKEKREKNIRADYICILFYLLADFYETIRDNSLLVLHA